MTDVTNIDGLMLVIPLPIISHSNDSKGIRAIAESKNAITVMPLLNICLMGGRGLHISAATDLSISDS
jgi:hypothetical protein